MTKKHIKIFVGGLTLIMLSNPLMKFQKDNLEDRQTYDLKVEKQVEIDVMASSVPELKPIEKVNEPIKYKIKPGDTLSGIAKKFGITVSELVAINGITDMNKIYVDDELLVGIQKNSNDEIVSTTTESFKERVINHVVEKGDTLHTLAIKYGASEENIRRINNIENNIIIKGKSLKIIIPNYNVDYLSNEEIASNINQSGIEDLIFSSSDNVDLPSFWNENLNNSQWIKAAYKYNIQPELLMAIASLETGHFTSEVFKNQNNVGGIRHNQAKEVKALGQQGGFETYSDVNSGILSHADLIRNYLNNEIETIKDFQNKYAPTSGDINDAESEYNRFWNENVCKLYEELINNKDFQEKKDEVLKEIHGVYIKLQGLDMTNPYTSFVDLVNENKTI